VYVLSSATVDNARANALATATAIGLAIAAATASNPVTFQFVGPLTLTTAQWDAIAGTVGGLVPGTVYYVDPITAGHLVGAAPGASGDFVGQVGTAFTATTMIVWPQSAIGPL